MKRICFVGASTTEGMGDESGAGWPGRLSHPHRDRIIPYNLGVGGQLLSEIRARAAAECRARILEYDLGGIVLCSGMNDIARVDGQSRTPMRRLQEAYVGLLQELKEIAPLIAIGPFPTLTARMPYHSEMTGLDLDFRNDDIAKVDEVYKTLAAENDVPYLAVFKGLRASDAYAASLDQNDSLHPNGAGYQLVAEKIAAWEPWQQLVSA